MEDIKVTTNEVDKIVNLNDDYFGLSFFKDVFIDEKEKVSYIKKVERLIRSSQEYLNLVSYIKNELNFSSCSVLTAVGGGQDVGIELHHHPFTLFDLVEIQLNYFIDNNKRFNTFGIAAIVTSLHYDFKVGLVPLSKTMHELAHSGGLFVPASDILGDHAAFFEQYEDYIPREKIDAYKLWVSMSKSRSKIDIKAKFTDDDVAERFQNRIAELSSNKVGELGYDV